MSDAMPTIKNKLWNTPMRDLLRGRATGRLDWKKQITTAGLPVDVAKVIFQIVKRTRLRAMEKVDVANELISHFKDGLAAGTGTTELMEKFGDPRDAARLIGRAKRRGRSLLDRTFNDGALVGIALELYHREHGKYPDAVGELTPVLLPQIPADRITGDPIKYRLIDGKPVVYSVGADRIDDGGTRPVKKGQYRSQNAADQWDVKPADAPRGDWVLYPPEPEDADYN